MERILNSIKRFLSNKNTVTIIGVLLGVLILYLGYNYRVNQATNPVPIPYALEEIQPRTYISEDMVDTINVAPALLGKGAVITNISNIVGKYTNVNAVVPKGSFFYSGQVIDKTDLPNAALLEIPEGEVAYNLGVDVDTSYGNSLLPGNTVDIYFKAFDDNGNIIVGKLVENVKILAVKDKSGNNVFENTSENRTPAIYIFAVPEEVHLLLRKTEYMFASQAELIPVPTYASWSSEAGELLMTSNYIKAFIESKSVYIPEETATNDEVTTETTTEE